MRSLSRNLSLMALALVAAPALMAQESTGQVVGTVKTKASEAMAGVTIRLSSPSLQGVRVVVSDAKGAFRAPLLPPGPYSITPVKAGFLAPKIDIEVGLGQVVRQEILMVQAQAQATVEVVATAASVDKSDVKTASNVTSELLDVLPRLTRGMDTAAYLSPGVAVGLNSRVMIRGAQTTENRFLLNGTDIADNVFGNTDGRGYYVDDSIQEMQVIQSPVHSRYGGFTGGVINAITKRGGNEWSGTLRGNYTRTDWSAQAPLGMRPTGSRPSNAGTSWGEDVQNREATLNMGGPILKDKLWFSVSTKLFPTSASPQTLNSTLGLNVYDPTAPAGTAAFASGAGQSGNPYSLFSKTKFYELKLTYAINSAHTLEVAGNTNTVNQINRLYWASPVTDPLVPQDNKNDYKTLAYTGVIGTNLTVEARIAKKHQVLIAGGDPALGAPIRSAYSNGSYYAFQNGTFNYADGGDNRDITTYTANVQWYSPSTAMGTHTVDVGFEILNQARQAANDQSPTSSIFYTWGRNADGTYRIAGSAGLSASAATTSLGINRVYLYFADKGTAKTDFHSYYVNDLWAINNKFQMMFGLRYDQVQGSDTLGSSIVKSSAFSPRVQATWDLKGDQSWLVVGSFARYTGKLNDSFTNLFTYAGNPQSEIYSWAGAQNNAATYAQITNLANWNITAAGLQGYGGPKNRILDPSTKAPYNDEYSLGLKHQFKDGSFIRFAYNQRKGGHFFNDFANVGDEVVVPMKFSAGSSRVYTWTYRTDDRLSRDYKNFEIEWNSRLSALWTFGGNYTYSVLKGNGEGSEGSNPPVSGDVIGDFEAVHVAAGRDFSYYAPYGYLTGDQPHRANLWLAFADKNKAGGSIYGSLMFNYRAGTAYSLTRTNTFEAQAQALAAGNPIYNQYPSTYTHYFGPRGIGRFNDTFGFDLKLGYEVPLVSKARFFAEVTVTNVFNHWQLVSYDTTNTAGSTALPTGGPISDYRAQGVAGLGTSASGFGTYGAGNYSGGRVVALSTGFKW